jgi:hypothetical protein
MKPARATMSESAPWFVFQAARPLLQPRRHPSVVPLEDGRVLVAGGTVDIHSPSFERHSVATPEVWDPGDNQWRAAPELVPTERRLHGVRALVWSARTGAWRRASVVPRPPRPGVVTLADGSQVRVGTRSLRRAGRRRPSSVIELMPRRRRPAPEPLSHPRIDATLTLLPDGRVLVTGGYETLTDYSWDDVDRSVRAVEIYDPASGRVTTEGSLVRARHYHGACLLPDGRVMLVGGRTDEGPELADVEIGSPAT